MDALTTAVFVFAAGAALYFGYLIVRKGIPAAYSKAKSLLTSGSAEVTKLRSEFAIFEGGVVSDIKARLAAVEAEVAALKKTPAAPPA